MANEGRESYTIGLRDLVYILAILVPIGATWGIYTTKMANLTDRVIEVREENVAMKAEDAHLREIIHRIELELNSNKNDINNLKERVQIIIDTRSKSNK